MIIILPKLNLHKLKLLCSKDIVQKFTSENDSLNESDLQIVHNYPIKSRDSKICSDKGTVNNDN